MGYQCNFPGCEKRATRQERSSPKNWALLVGTEPANEVLRVFCPNHYGEDECPGHVASANDSKVCGRCGIHIDSLRPY